MNSPFDTIIVGAGLAGACAALHLCRHERVLVLEAENPASGASGAAAGLVNPLMGQRAKTVWRADKALEALHDTLALADAASLFAQSGLLRPAAHARQAGVFRDVADALPQHAAWLSAEAARARFPAVAASEGALRVRRGGAIRVPDFVDALLAAARQHGAEVHTGAYVTGWEENAGSAFVDVRREHGGDRLAARRVVLALGYGYRRHADLSALNLHAVKGQTVRVAAPAGLTDLIPLSGQGYVVSEGKTLVVGSSYERDFTDLRPSETQTRQILTKASRMLPALHRTAVLDAVAGVRVTVPGTRLPMLGPLPGRARLWIFTGLGSKGLLMAPLLARDLPAFFEKPATIPPEVRVG